MNRWRTRSYTFERYWLTLVALWVLQVPLLFVWESRAFAWFWIVGLCALALSGVLRGFQRAIQEDVTNEPHERKYWSTRR
jgi:hypothetical protein